MFHLRRLLLRGLFFQDGVVVLGFVILVSILGGGGEGAEVLG
jgi:hypothetical protein